MLHLQELKAQLAAPDKGKPKESKAAQKDQAAEQIEAAADDDDLEASAEAKHAPGIAPKKVRLCRNSLHINTDRSCTVIRCLHIC